MMTVITLPEELVARLQKEAHRQSRSIVELVEEMFNRQYGDAETDQKPVNNPLLRMWEIAHEANLDFKFHDTSERSREILETEYADHLLKRMRCEDTED